MKNWKLCVVAGLGLVVATVLTCFAGETKYAGTIGGAAATAPAVTFGPQVGPIRVLSVQATTDKALGCVAFYSRPAQAYSKWAPTSNAAISATNVLINNVLQYATNGDSVVYVHADGTCDYRTLVGGGTGYIYLSSGISEAGTNGDFVYEVTLQGKVLVGTAGTAPGTNATVDMSDCFTTGGDSPLYVTVDGTSNTCLQVTAN